MLTFTFLWRYVALSGVIFSLVACQGLNPSPELLLPSPQDPIAELLLENSLPAESPLVTLEKLGFAVQVGAFSQMDNAVRLEQQLQEQGVDAYHFLHESGFYKVRFGDYDLYARASNAAARLRDQGLIDSFFIVIPEDYAVAGELDDNHQLVRERLVSTARRFLGVPYRWGGEDRHNGFDCSGLTMVSYRLNGLKLPRNSRAQFKAGRVVSKKNLQQGDLVFFATKGGKRVTHVGMYVGRGQFIHAPRPGKTVRIASLSNSFFSKTYVGAKSYL